MEEGRNKLDALNRENEISELFRIVQSASIKSNILFVCN